MPNLPEIRRAAKVVHSVFPGTPQYTWPLLSKRLEAEVWVKHENETPIGAFKVRGGLSYLEALAQKHPVRGVITATRGNHGQSIAFAAARHGVNATIVVPHNNSVEKNAAMRAFGAELVVHGRDFQEAAEYMQRLAVERDLHEVASFHPWLVRGVATYALEFFDAVRDLDVVYVPIGMGSGICGTIAVRDALGLATQIVGVVSDAADAYAQSFEAGHIITTESADTFADGVACRVPNPDAFAMIRRGATRVIRVNDAEVKAAMRAYFTDIHRVVEGAGAVPLAAAMREREYLRGKKIGLVISGGNIDRDLFAGILAAHTG
ncbi:MAG TPA: threonine dehydratase [Candidatus Baltobacteraceae bacterium]